MGRLTLLMSLWAVYSVRKRAAGSDWCYTRMCGEHLFYSIFCLISTSESVEMGLLRPFINIQVLAFFTFFFHKHGKLFTNMWNFTKLIIPTITFQKHLKLKKIGAFFDFQFRCDSENHFRQFLVQKLTSNETTVKNFSVHFFQYYSRFSTILSVKREYQPNYWVPFHQWVVSKSRRFVLFCCKIFWGQIFVSKNYRLLVLIPCYCTIYILIIEIWNAWTFKFPFFICNKICLKLEWLTQILVEIVSNPFVEILRVRVFNNNGAAPIRSRQ